MREQTFAYIKIPLVKNYKDTDEFFEALKSHLAPENIVEYNDTYIILLLSQILKWLDEAEFFRFLEAILLVDRLIIILINENNSILHQYDIDMNEKRKQNQISLTWDGKSGIFHGENI